MGRVLCKAQVTDCPIAVGDLLATSSLQGYAMRVTDHNRAFGAVLGKATGRLEHQQPAQLPISAELRRLDSEQQVA